MRFGIWWFVVAQYDAAEKNCNIDAQLQSQICFGKFTYCMTSGVLVRTNLFIGSRFWTTYTNYLLSALYSIATCRKKII